MSDAVTMRPGTVEDVEFLFRLLEASLGPYVEQTYGRWDEDEQRARFFASPSPETHQIVEQEGIAIGCLKVRRMAEELNLNRVFLMPEYQSHGIGTRLVQQVLAEGRELGVPVRLRVLRVNPARRLYERLGFVVTGETETHVVMEHAPPRETPARG